MNTRTIVFFSIALLAHLYCHVFADPQYNDTAKPMADAEHNAKHQQGTPYDIDASFTEPETALPDLIEVQNHNVAGVFKGVYPDPLNDNAKLDWVVKVPSAGGKVQVKVEGRKNVGAIYYVAVRGNSSGGGGSAGSYLLYADVSDISQGNLFLRDDILMHGCSDNYEYAPGVKEFYCGSTEKGWGGIRLFTKAAPAAGKTWYVVLYRGTTQIGAYSLLKVENISEWFHAFSSDTNPVLYPAHYSAKLIQAQSQDGVPAALAANPNCPTISFAIVHVDLDVDTNNDGTIVTGFDANGLPQTGYNDHVDCVAVDDSSEPVAMGLIVPMNFDAQGLVTTSSRQPVSARVRPLDINRGRVSLGGPGSKYANAEGGTQLTPIWDLSEQGVTLPETLYISFSQAEMGSSRAYGALREIAMEHKWKYRESDSNFLDTSPITDRTRVVLTPPVSVAPKHSVVKIWAPLDGVPGWEGRSLGPKEVVRRLEPVGWSFEIYTIRPAAQARANWNQELSLNLPQSAFRQCSYSNFRTLPEGAGIIIAHGHAGFTACYFTGANDPNLATWQTEDGQPIEGISILNENPPKNIGGINYTRRAYVEAGWFTAKWNNATTTNEAIVWFMSCLDGAGLNSVVSAAGGRSRLGYAGLSSGGAHRTMAEALFGQMRRAEVRTVGAAFYEAASKSRLSGLVLRGEDGKQCWTTLGPGIAKISQHGFAMFPSSNDFRTHGTRNLVCGGIIFDTRMRDATANSCITGSDLLERNWITHPTGGQGLRYAIRFMTARGCEATVVANECQNDCPAGETGRALRTAEGHGQNVTWNWPSN